MLNLIHAVQNRNFQKDNLSGINSEPTTEYVGGLSETIDSTQDEDFRLLTGFSHCETWTMEVTHLFSPGSYLEERKLIFPFEFFSTSTQHTQPCTAAIG